MDSITYKKDSIRTKVIHLIIIAWIIIASDYYYMEFCTIYTVRRTAYGVGCM